MKNLDDIFSKYDEKKAAEKKAIEERLEKERAERNASGALIGSVVLPVVQRLTEAVKAKGHKAILVDNTKGSHSYPHVEFKFTPVPQVANPYGGPTYIPESKLTFIHGDGGVVNIRKEINSAGSSGRNDFRYGSGGDGVKARPDQVTDEYIENQVLMFVEAVLGSN